MKLVYGNLRSLTIQAERLYQITVPQVTFQANRLHHYQSQWMQYMSVVWRTYRLIEQG